MAKKGHRYSKEKLNKKIQEHNKQELEKYQKVFSPQTRRKETTKKQDTTKETTKKQEVLTLAEIIHEKRVKKKKQNKLLVVPPHKDIWNNIEVLEKKVDYDLSLLTDTHQMEIPQVDEEIWKQFTSYEFVQSMDKFLNNTMYDVQGLLNKLSPK